jgi:hypothetical protein
MMMASPSISTRVAFPTQYLLRRACDPRPRSRQTGYDFFHVMGLILLRLPETTVPFDTGLTAESGQILVITTFAIVS